MDVHNSMDRCTKVKTDGLIDRQIYSMQDRQSSRRAIGQRSKEDRHADHAEQAEYADGRADSQAQQPEQAERGNQVELAGRTGRQSRQTGRQVENTGRPSRQRFEKTNRSRTYTTILGIRRRDVQM